MTKAFIAVILMALVTYIPRVLPLAVFRKEIRSPYIKTFLYYVPYAVLGALTFPDIFSSTGNLYPAICGTGIALLLAYFERSLVVVALGAILTVFLTSFLF
ncbi:AzlD domain-containing protein [Anaeromicropila populeti]|uniref:Branched-chain amino acid transport protein n=1 Tax=Anaeromicropila populeti TaxID=37658 RepID=A0A1I6JC37_9FIRM|nr:AzlD domain-containing protein [Anaeromicropila populeti]SFR76506.1 Branched-chain amino acid transport protein [Anaeromicropila populeti]